MRSGGTATPSAAAPTEAPAASQPASVAASQRGAERAAVACDTFTILNHRTDLDQSGDWKKLYVDPFQAKYPGIKTITTESIRTTTTS